MKYNIPEQNLTALEKRLAALSRRTVKAGNVAVTCTRTGMFRDEPLATDSTKLVRTVEVEVTGDMPAYNGWHFMATLCRTEEGNVVRAIPGYEVPAQYRDGDHTCDHCHTVRQRRDTYVLRHDDGRTVRVGSSCLQDFLQHSADGLSLAARLCMEAHSMAESATQRGWLGGNGTMAATYRFDLHTFLVHVAQVVLSDKRFVTRSRAREAGTLSTADRAYNSMQGRTPLQITPEAEELATRAREYVCFAFSGEIFSANAILDEAEFKSRLMASYGVQKTISDFEHNLLTVARSEAIEVRLIGIAAYIVEAFRRAHREPVQVAQLNTAGLSRIFTMFTAAKSSQLKRPAIRLVDDAGNHLQLNLAPATSQNAGYIYVKGPSGTDNYFGKISPDGLFMPVKSCPSTVRPQLNAFADDPETIAAKYGKVTGCCCFCGRNLTDDRSTDVGYGPVCAGKFGLHWGHRHAVETAPVAEAVAA